MSGVEPCGYYHQFAYHVHPFTAAGAPITMVTCTCGAFNAAANWMGTTMHGPTCALTPPNERYLWGRIASLEARVKELEAK